MATVLLILSFCFWDCLFYPFIIPLEGSNMKVVYEGLSTSYLKSLSDLVHRQGSDVSLANG